jgi:hypothetical protein
MIQNTGRLATAFINVVVTRVTLRLWIRIQDLTLSEAFADGDVVTDELDDLEDSTVVGHLPSISKGTILTTIDAIDSEADIRR